MYYFAEDWELGTDGSENLYEPDILSTPKDEEVGDQLNVLQSYDFHNSQEKMVQNNMAVFQIARRNNEGGQTFRDQMNAKK